MRKLIPRPIGICALRNSEQGFTLIEALLVTVMILALSGLAYQSYVVYKRRAYQNAALEMMMFTTRAMEAGKSGYEIFPWHVAVALEDPEDMETPGVEDLVPGLVVPDNFRIWIEHNPSCINTCVEDWVESRHCSVQQRCVYMVLRDSSGQRITTLIENAEAGEGC